MIGEVYVIRHDVNLHSEILGEWEKEKEKGNRDRNRERNGNGNGNSEGK